MLSRRDPIKGDITEDHVRSFLACCKSRKLPNADVALAAVSIRPPLLAVRSYVEERRLCLDERHPGRRWHGHGASRFTSS